MRGKKPTPLALKIARGAPATRPERNRSPYPPGSTEPPTLLSGAALWCWNEMAPKLAEAGLLTEKERMALMALCLAYEKMAENPTIHNIDCLRRMLNEFGLTPATRSRVNPPSDALQDDLQDFLDKKKA